MCEPKVDQCKIFKEACKSCICNPIYLRELPGRRVTKALCNELILSDQQIGMYMSTVLNALKKGLKKDTNPTATVKCFPTYVQDLPDGTEQGKYFAVDLGGSHCRILLVTLEGGEITVVQEVYDVSEELMSGSGTDLFDFLAQSIAAFAASQGVAADNLPLALTWSFPLIQTGLKIGIIERWTKGYSCSGCIGNDVVKLLEEAIARREDLQVDVVAVVNDTTGTLMAAAVKDNDCRIGLIAGTGCNGCYVEKQFIAELFDEPDKGSGIVIINMEIGALGDDGELDFCRTAYDIAVDKASINPGRQLNEKLCASLYIGEIVRLVCVRFANEGIMFEGKLSEKFRTPHSFTAEFISEIESEKPCVYDNVKRILEEEMDMPHATEEDYQDLRFICSCITKRSAHLFSALMVVLIRKMGYRKTTIGIDGSFYKLHPHLHNIMMHKIQELLIPDTYKFKIVLAEDGSGIGAALCAAVSSRPPKQEGGDAPAAPPAEDAAMPPGTPIATGRGTLTGVTVTRGGKRPESGKDED